MLDLYEIRVGRFGFYIVARSQEHAQEVANNIALEYSDGADMESTGSTLIDFVPLPDKKAMH